MEIHFAILGPVRVRVAGRLEADRLRPKEAAVLGVLLVNLEHPMSISGLVDLVWGETPDEKMPGNPGDTLELYRKRISRVLREMDIPARIRRVGPTYQLDVDREAIDLYAFRSLMERAHDAAVRGEHRRARDLAVEALALWRYVEPLPELSGVRVDAWRQRIIKDEWATANNLLLQEMIAVGDQAQALARLNDLQAMHPDIDLFQRRRLEVLYGMGRFQDGLAYYLDVHKGLRADADDECAQSWRMFHDGLRTRHVQRLRTDESVPHNAQPFYQVPHDADDFTGRDVLLEKLDSLALRDGRPRPGVVVLSGPPGMGKTALAVRWAHLRRDLFRNGVAFLDLHGMTQTSAVGRDAVVGELLQARDVAVERIPGSGNRIAKLQQLLAAGPTLIILDNAYNSAHIRDLLPTLSACTVLVTSRQRLNQLGAEWGSVRSLTVPPLAPQHATELLLARLYMHAPPHPDVRRLVELCGGSPLAVKLVAQYIATGPHAPLDAYVTELRDQHRILDIGADSDSANASLQAVFATSYRRLTEPAQRMFRLVGLHAGPTISLPAVVALAGLSTQAVRHVLETLVNAHLIDRPAPERYQVHDLLRAYGARLANLPEHEAESRSAELRILDFYLRAADSAAGRVFPWVERPPVLESIPGVIAIEFATDREAIAWCARERANLSAAIRYASRHNYHRYACLITNMITEMFKKYGYHRELIELSKVSMNSAKSIGWVEAEASALNDIGYLYAELDEFNESRKYLRWAEYIARSEDNELGLATSLTNLAKLESRIGDPSYAVELLNESMKYAESVRNLAKQAGIMLLLGEIYHHRHEYETAISYYQQSCARRAEIGDRRGMGQALCSLGSVQHDMGQFSLADAYAQQALSAYAEVGDIPGCIRTATLLARIHQELRDFTDAIGYGRRAVDLARRVDARWEAEALHVLAGVCRAAGHLEAAREGWEQALKIFQDSGNDHLVQVIGTRLSELPEGEGRLIFRREPMPNRQVSSQLLSGAQGAPDKS